MVSGVLTSPPPDDGTLGAATEGPGDAHSLLSGSQVPPEPLQQVSCGKPFAKHCSLAALLASRGSASDSDGGCCRQRRNEAYGLGKTGRRRFLREHSCLRVGAALSEPSIASCFREAGRKVQVATGGWACRELAQGFAAITLFRVSLAVVTGRHARRAVSSGMCQKRTSGTLATRVSLMGKTGC